MEDFVLEGGGGGQSSADLGNLIKFVPFPARRD